MDYSAADGNDLQDQLHVVMLPYFAFGHVLPFLELGRALARRGHRVSLLAPAGLLRRLPDPEAGGATPLLSFVALPPLPDLPASVASTADLPPSLRPLLQKSLDSLRPFFAEFVAGCSPRPDFVVHDFAAYWAGAAASLPAVFFSTFPASTAAFFGRPADPADYIGPPRWVPFPTAVAFRRHELLRLFLDSVLPNASGVPESARLKMGLAAAAIVAQRSCPELEPDWFPLLSALHDRPVVPLGLLPSTQAAAGEDPKISEFLEAQSTGSAIYVALGSEAVLTGDLLRELALGLELSNVPFLWALRKPVGGEDAAPAPAVLPEGFEERTRGRGLVVRGWAPQVQVLGHEAVGAFLTHCGWSSVVEGLQQGRALVLLPVCADQGLNARAMAEKGVGVEVERDEDSGFFSRSAVAEAVRKVVAGAEGAKVRARAKEVSKLVGDVEKQDEYVDGFVQCLKEHRARPGNQYIHT